MAESKTTFYIDEDVGEDAPNNGTEKVPFKSLQFAYLQHQGKAQYQTRKSKTGDDEAARMEWKPAAKAGLKKVEKFYASHLKKQEKDKELVIRQKKEEEERQKTLDEAKKIVIEEDSSLPDSKTIKLDDTSPEIQLRTAESTEKEVALDQPGRGTRVRARGRVDRVAKQKDVYFVTLRDGYGKMQCLLTGQLSKSYDAITLTKETSMEIVGELWEVPAGYKAPFNRELHADYFKIIAKAAGGKDDIKNRIPEKRSEDNQQALLDQRHLDLRTEIIAQVMSVRSAVESAFHQTYAKRRMRKVSPPALVQTQVEGGSTLFKFDYYGEEAFLTQSSQLYLETCLPSLGDVYCIEKSFRAEKSLTRRHLSEYTHVEAELDFITFEELLDHLEDVIVDVVNITLSDPIISDYVHKLNPAFQAPQKPFMRMKYTDAIDWLIENKIPNEEGQPHQFGDDIAEAAERRMTDIINKPIFLTHFPAHIKAFYMQKDPNDKRVTESVDCLMPTVGEIVGGSMRMDKYDELMEAYEHEGISPDSYYWYTDQRKYGSSPHGGYGLGLERFLAWLCAQHTVRDCCLYPRYMGRCTP